MNGDEYFVQRLGTEQGPYSVSELQMQARSGMLKSETPLRLPEGEWFPAKELPGVFSEKQWIVALILSVLVGSLGIDRMYVGQIGLGVLKLITCGGFGVWYIVDIVLFALDNVKDADGLPLPH